MTRPLDAFLRLITGLAVAFALSGCAGLGGFSGGTDPDSLLNAIVSDRADDVRRAVESRRVSVDQRIPAPVYMEGAPIITLAARAGAVEVTRYLISAGANVNARTPANETALMLAAYFHDENGSGRARYARHERIASLLVNAGAHLENEAHNYTPLSYAAYQGHDHMIRFLLERGARVNPETWSGEVWIPTPLMMAAMQGHQSSALLLLRAGADARVRVHRGHTAAELARKYRGASLVPVLACAERLSPGLTFSQACERGAGRVSDAGSAATAGAP